MNVEFRIMNVNVHGLLAHKSELEFQLSDQGFPDLVALTETLLDKSVKHIDLYGYALVSRRDRDDGRQGGGIALYCRPSLQNSITHLSDSKTCERSWHMLHTNQGPVLVGVWYRPPCYGEVLSIRSLETEWKDASSSAVGSVILGDMNVHNKLWLQHSASNSPEGRELFNVCCRLGLQEKVRKPTRGNYLLDLLLTDIPTGVSCSVLPRISDHNSVLSKFALRVDQLASKTQRTWLFDKADWHGLLAELDATDWKHFFGNLAVELAVEKFTCYVLECTARYIPKVKRPPTVSSSMAQRRLC